MKRERRIRNKGEERKRWKTGGIIAALTAAVSVFAAMVWTEKSILDGYEKKVVYTAAVEIPKGQLITEENCLQYFKEQQIDAACVPRTALSEPGKAAGLVAAGRIDEGTILTEGMFQRLELILAELDRPVVAGFKADDIYQLAGGVLRAGDRVNIYSVREEEVCLAWKNIFVQQVFDASGKAVPNADGTTAVQRVNVYLNEADAADFYASLSAGSLRVVKLLE